MDTPLVPQRPYLKPWWRVTIDDTSVSFHYGEDVLVCRGRSAVVLLPLILPLLDGTKTVDEIATSFGSAAAGHIRSAITTLAARGLLIDGPAIPADVAAGSRESAHLIAALHGNDVPLANDAGALLRLRIALLGEHARDAIRLSLGGAGATVEALPWNAPDDAFAGTDLVIAAPSPRELPELSAWNERALRAHRTWLQVLPFDGYFAAVGPFYVPGETACYDCFRRRRAANVAYPAQYWGMQATPATYPVSPPLDLVAAGLATLAVLRWFLRRDDELIGRFSALELRPEAKLSTHAVYRVPRCPTCAEVAVAAAPLPWFEAEASWTA